MGTPTPPIWDRDPKRSFILEVVLRDLSVVMCAELRNFVRCMVGSGVEEGQRVETDCYLHVNLEGRSAFIEDAVQLISLKFPIPLQNRICSCSLGSKTSAVFEIA
ncbi:unnamed protein product [Toxocara canis]|uniref:Uncharacterized protein n=1 Tax=Toxocara canis TaxID=6265 RepID=A0A183UJ86_TOXCA|nr:unnamed protein product [Toxocara canis]